MEGGASYRSVDARPAGPLPDNARFGQLRGGRRRSRRTRRISVALQVFPVRQSLRGQSRSRVSESEISRHASAATAAARAGEGEIILCCDITTVKQEKG